MGTQEGNPPAQTPSGATGDKGGSGANPSSNDDDFVKIPKSDYNKIISQRDANFNKAKTAEEKAEEALSWKEQQEEEKARGVYVTNFLEENSEKYPDVKKADLLHATTPEEVEAIAKRTQQVYTEAESKALAKIQASDDDSLTDEQIEEEIAKLDPEKQKDAFERNINLQFRRKR